MNAGEGEGVGLRGSRRKRGPSGWTLALVVAFFAMGALACQSEVDPESVSASLVAYGEFEIEKGLPTLLTTTSSIRCELGILFGVDYRIDVANDEYGIVPIEFRWIHPELAVPARQLWGTESAARRPNPLLAWREKSLEGRVLWSFEHPDELVPGRYEFQIRARDGGSVLLSRTFDVDGC